MSAFKIQGYIAGASSIERFTKKDGTEGMKAILYIKEVSNEPHPTEVAVKVSGDDTYYTGCVGMTVEVEYAVRVFPFTGKKTGAQTYGNDIYARRIEIINADRSAMLDINQEKEA